MTSLDAIVVGGGIFGKVIGRALRLQGRRVCILDQERELAGSRPAACLIRPSWLSSMSKTQVLAAMAVLEELYVVHDIEFQMALGRTTGLRWVDPAAIMAEPHSVAEVTHVEPGRVHTRREELVAPLVVVAAGIWTKRLLPQYPQRALVGAAFLWRGEAVTKPFIKVWAPYKQIVGFNRGDGAWVGDGTAILRRNWTEERLEQSRARCTQYVVASHTPEALIGARPYAKGHKPCLLEQVSPGLWVASGGAKNGTIAAAWCASVLREHTD